MADQAKLTVEEIAQRLRDDPEARAELTKLLARDFPDEYLRHVKVDENKLKDISAKFLSSDKEWQE